MKNSKIITIALILCFIGSTILTVKSLKLPVFAAENEEIISDDSIVDPVIKDGSESGDGGNVVTLEDDISGSQVSEDNGTEIYISEDDDVSAVSADGLVFEEGDDINADGVGSCDIKVYAKPTSAGYVSPGGEGIEAGTILTLEATPVAGYKFVRWESQNGGMISADNPYNHYVTGSLTIYAVFEEIKYYTVKAVSANKSQGTVSGSGSFEEGSDVTLTASAASGYRFVNWTLTDDPTVEVSTDAEYTITSISSDYSLTANFEVKPESVYIFDKLYTTTEASESLTFHGIRYYYFADDKVGIALGEETDGNYRFCNNIPEYASLEKLYANFTCYGDVSLKFSNLPKLNEIQFGPSFDMSKATDAYGMFADDSSLTEISGLKYLDTSSVQNFVSMFEGCSAFTSLDLSELDTSSATNMKRMFYQCLKLESVDLSGLDTSKVENFIGMFDCCKALKKIKSSGLDTSSAEAMGWMFAQCESLESIDVSNFDTSNVIDMSYMFWDCQNLKSISLDNFDTSKVENFYNMFDGCSSIEALDLSDFDTSKAQSTTEMFKGCSKLSSLDISSFDLSEVLLMSDMLKGDTSLKVFYTPQKLSEAIELPLTMYDQDDLNTPLTSVSASITESKTLVSTIITVTFDVNAPEGEGSVTPASKTVIAAKGFTYGDLPTPTLEGYTFARWALKADGTTTITSDSEIPEDKYEDHSIYAIWHKNPTLSVIIDPEGAGTVDYQSSYSYGATAALTLTSVSDDYTFSGYRIPDSSELITDKSYSFKITEDTEITAVFTSKNHYTVTIINDDTKGTAGGSGTYVENSVVTVTAAANDGYRFIAWLDEDMAIASKNAEYSFKITGNRQLTAKYSKIVHVIYNYNDESGGKYEDTTDLVEGDEYTVLTCSQEWEDHKFVKWNTDALGLGDDYLPGDTLTAGKDDFNLYAIWKEIENCTVTFMSDGSVYAAQTVEKGDKASKPKTDPTKSGYKFTGWYTKEDSSEQTSDTEWDFDDEIIENTTLYAGFKQAYTIKYDKNAVDAYGYMSDQTTYLNTSTRLSPVLFKRTGYDFNGWNTLKTGLGKSYEGHDLVTNLTGGGKTVTLYAQWSIVTYNIYYNLYGGINNSANRSTYNVNTKFTLSKPTRDGYEFGGWYKDEGFTEPVTSIKSGTTGNITLYAKWTIKGYSITYYLNGGKNNSGNPSKYTGDADIILKNPTKTGYIFDGWYKDSKFKTRISKITKGTKGKISLYAKWTGYTIKYVLHGGTNPASNPTIYTGKTTVYLKNPKKTGYKFGGWYKESDYRTRVTKFEPGDKGNVTLYAQWVANKYTIVYHGNGATSGTVTRKTYKYGKEYTLKLNKYKKKGYTFTGWNTAKDGSGTDYEDEAVIKNLSVKDGKTIHLYAMWEKNE